MSKGDLTNEQWERLQSLLPPQKPNWLMTDQVGWPEVDRESLLQLTSMTRIGT